MCLFIRCPELFECLVQDRLGRHPLQLGGFGQLFEGLFADYGRGHPSFPVI
jgi:hypothetical protein